MRRLRFQLIKPHRLILATIHTAIIPLRLGICALLSPHAGCLVLGSRSLTCPTFDFITSPPSKCRYYVLVTHCQLQDLAGNLDTPICRRYKIPQRLVSSTSNVALPGKETSNHAKNAVYG